MITVERKEELLNRLKKIEGQIKGLQRMVSGERGCPEILTQISAAHEGLRVVGIIMMRNYLDTCVTSAIRSRKPDSIYDDFMAIIHKFAR